MRWLRKLCNDILRRWKNNELTLADAATLLVETGLTPENAWDILQRT